MATLGKRNEQKKPPKKWTAAEMEIAIVEILGAFDFRKYFVLPRSRFGLNEVHHEADLLALSRSSGVLNEIEIKVSRADFLADLRKRHSHKSPVIKRLFYAVPEALKDFALERLPEGAGLVVVPDAGRSWIEKRPTAKKTEKPSETTIRQFFELLSMRYWSERSREMSRFKQWEAKLSTRKATSKPTKEP